ncbi:MAG: glycosyltransferase family 4 protein [Spirochaetes bacterium]|nr:glycosyltransferase family 4 protein [Spirochaetota bacterium]
MKLKSIAVLAAISASGETGGAEKLYQGLTDALNKQGINTDLIKITTDEKNFDSIKKSYLEFYDLDLKIYNGIISTKAPSFIINHKNHICYLLHTMRVFYDMFEFEFKSPTEENYRQKKFIQDLDTLALKYPRTKKIFVIGNEVKNRLKKYNNLDSKVLYLALLNENYLCKNYEYIYLPGRLHRWKRVDLVIEAMKHVKSPVKLKIAGKGEDETFFKSLAKKLKNVEFLGYLSDEEMKNKYADALAVVFPPIREDFGLITLEAFKSKKPVITCSDSGEPKYIVKNDFSGFICNPEPKELASKFDQLYNNKELSKNMGINGYNSIIGIKWENTAYELIKALEESL